MVLCVSVTRTHTCQIDVNFGKWVSFSECAGEMMVVDNFFIKKPWMNPFCISSIKEDHIRFVTNDFPRSLCVYGHTYSLAGFTMFLNLHFTAVVWCHGDAF